jgi:sigma-B regulation protein RsbU (phosphoserine phosphatase)
LHSCDNRALVKVVFLDITGHGELVACVARAVHRLLHQYAPDTRPARLLYLVNQQFPYFTPGGILATSLSAVYDSRSGELRYAYGGQPGMLLWRAQQRQWRSLAPPRDSMCGLPFGVSEAACYEEGGVSLSSGDILLMFSDGVPEMRSTAGTLLQPEGVLRLAQQCTEEIVANPSVPLPALADAFLKRIQDFHGSSDFSDDTTLLWMRRLPGESL